jgi:hypothetical protein
MFKKYKALEAKDHAAAAWWKKWGGNHQFSRRDVTDLIYRTMSYTMLRWGIENFVIPHHRILGSAEYLINTSTCRLRWLCQASFGCADITDSQTFGYVSATETW